ncbi:MAG: hypothetical protein ACD_3C00067G0002 [uncultured bacterium (gcode 4)]|uniref:Uncharacterized protein n=1 Tax=uncultured bacterium (gcode 4) TaxID=1234023 RepID=K2FZF5_9BACT|nr:MAG: hypothetical protein ACD_3C00067G0002 [uncultured bacterium (gcode 4)]
MKKEIIFYQKENWDIPVKMFLDSLKIKDPYLLATILNKLELLSLNLLWLDDLKYLGDRIFELRIKKSSNISQIFYFTLWGDSIILLDWIIKKDDKLKNWALKKFTNYRDDYLIRRKKSLTFK